MRVLASGSRLGACPVAARLGRGLPRGCVARRGAGPTTRVSSAACQRRHPCPASASGEPGWIGRPWRDPRHHLPFADHSRIHRTPGAPVTGGERCRRPPGRPRPVPPRNSSPGPADRGARPDRRGPVEPGRGFGGTGGGHGRSTPKLAVMIASNSASTQAGSAQTSSANPLATLSSATASREVPDGVDFRCVESSIVDHFPATLSCSIPGHVPHLSISIVRTGDCVKHCFQVICSEYAGNLSWSQVVRELDQSRRR